MIISCVLFSLEAHNIVLVRLVDLRLPHLAGVGGQLVPRGAEHLVVGVHLRLHHELGVRLGYLVLVLQIFFRFQCKYFFSGPNLLPEEAGVELQLGLGEGDGAVPGHQPGEEVRQTRAAATINTVINSRQNSIASALEA